MPDRMSNSPYREASWAAVSAEIATGLEPGRVALDPLHHVAGHDPHRSHAVSPPTAQRTHPLEASSSRSRPLAGDRAYQWVLERLAHGGLGAHASWKATQPGELLSSGKEFTHQLGRLGIVGG